MRYITVKHKHTILPATVGWEMLALKRASGRAPISTTGICANLCYVKVIQALKACSFLALPIRTITFPNDPWDHD